MASIPEPVARFLEGKRIAVAGVSREAGQAANAIYRKLRDSGHEALPVNPNASQVEGVRCYPDLASIPGALDGVVIATHPDVSVELVRQCGAGGVPRVWFHRSSASACNTGGKAADRDPQPFSFPLALWVRRFARSSRPGSVR